MKEKIFIAAAVILSSTVHAQQVNSNKDSTTLLRTVIVTANKIEQKQQETGKVLTVIDQQELQRSAGKTIAELLNRHVGFTIGGANSTLGTVQTVYTRGASGANTLILLDGIPLYDGSGISSEFDLNSFAVDQAERIEILKGAQSTLYGSDAVAGVINIISKKPDGQKVHTKLNLSAGSFNSFRGGMNLSGTIKKGLEYFVGYSKVYSEGFSSANDSSGIKTFDDDGFKQDAVLASIGFKPTEQFSVKLYSKYHVNRAEVDAGAFTDDTDYRYKTTHFTTGTALKLQSSKAAFFFNYNFNQYYRAYNNDSVNIGGYSTDPSAFYLKFIKEHYKGISHFAELYSNLNLHRNLNLVGGIDYRSNATSQEYLYISNYGPYEPLPISDDSARSEQISGFTSFLYNNKHGFTAGLGGRINNHSIYGRNGTFSFNPAYSFKNIKLFTNVSSAYRVPSLYQLYSEFGNKNLKPEQTVSYEAGFQYTGKNLTARIVGFKRDTRDVFVFYSNPVTFNSLYINEDRQKDQGIELEASAIICTRVSVSANYAYIDGEVRAKDVNGKDTTFFNLFRRPKNTVNLSVTYEPLAKLHLSAHCRTVGSFYEPKYGQPPVKLSGYYTIDLYSEYNFSERVKTFIDLKNITDQLYFDQEGFNTRRFNMNAGVSLAF